MKLMTPAEYPPNPTTMTTMLWNCDTFSIDGPFPPISIKITLATNKYLLVNQINLAHCVAQSQINQSKTLLFKVTTNLGQIRQHLAPMTT